MKNIYSFIALFAFALGIAQQGAPAAPYYNGFNWTLTGIPLKTALANKITSTHTHQLNYSDAKEAILVTDLDPADATHTNLLLLYGFSSTICPASTSDDKDHRRRNKNFQDDGTAASCLWNREHTFAKALGTPDLGTTGPGGDAHHLRACDKKRNADRENDKFASGTGNSHEMGTTWYPGDEWKGDVARMVMYMYLRYGSQCLPSNVAVGNAVSNDANMIDLLLQWNADDPVSQYEDNRNTYLGNASNTYGQGNRNPFIDNPYLATVIWGGPVAQNRWPNVFLSTPDFAWASTVSIYPNPAHDKINVSSSKDLESIDIISVNGQVVLHVDKPVFANDVYTIENLPNGFYIVKLSTGDQSLAKKVIVN